MRWSYTFAPVGEGTELTESWEILPALLKRYAQSDDGAAVIADRTATARSGIAATLAAIKNAAES